MKPSTIILGAGFGGLAAASTLRRLLPTDFPITIIDKSPDFYVGATKTWMMLGEKTPSEITRSRKSLLPSDIIFHQAEIEQIDLERGIVTTSREQFTAQCLVIALGADVTMDGIPGLSSAAKTFYTFDGALHLGGVLKHFAGGEIVILIPRTPFKCPPAPYEAAMLLDHTLKQRGLRNRTRLSIYTVEPSPMATAGPEIGSFIRGLLEERGISYHPMKKTKSVDGEHRSILFEDGSETAYDLLIAIPPHVAPRPVQEAGLTDQSGWIPVDPKTMRVKGVTSSILVYAIGDITSVPLPGRYKPDIPLSLPKAGVFAASHGIIAAQHIAVEFGVLDAAESFDGKGFCYIEVGNGIAVKGDGSFFEMPHPKMENRPPDKEQFQDKLAWVDRWLHGKIG